MVTSIHAINSENTTGLYIFDFCLGKQPRRVQRKRLRVCVALK